MSYVMAVTTSIKELKLTEASEIVSDGGAYVDLRDIDRYLDVHIHGSFALEYERGPGMPVRARDCIPLDIPFVLLDEGEHDLREVAAALRGKGFSVAGSLPGGVRTWGEARGAPASTEVHEGSTPPSGTVLMVGDPGAPVADAATVIPIESLFRRTDELRRAGSLVIAAGRGVRAGIAVGILERAGIEDVKFWRNASWHSKVFGKAGVVRHEPAR